jgi:hypothetical protein
LGVGAWRGENREAGGGRSFGGGRGPLARRAVAVPGLCAPGHPGRPPAAGDLHRLRRQPAEGRGQRAARRRGLAAQAKLVAAAAETNLAAQRAGLSAAADLLQRDANAPIDAAETALRAAGGEAMAVAVVSPTDVLAVAGRDASADWKAAARAAAASGRSLWIGGGTTGRLYVAMAAPVAGGRGFVIASSDPSPDRRTGQGRGQRPDAGRRPDPGLRRRPIQGATNLREAFSLSPDDLGDGAAALRGQSVDGQALDVAIQPLAQGDLLAAAGARKPAPSPISTARSWKAPSRCWPRWPSASPWP